MIETPLYGRFIGENRKLVFTVPIAYLGLVRLCVISGIAVFAYGFFGPMLGMELPLYQQWWLMLGLLLMVAGAAATFSLQSITLDLRERIYRRRQGPGLIPSTTRGSISDLDAMVLLTEQNLGMGGVTYHLVLHWKGRKEPPMVVQSDTRVLPSGAPLNGAAGPLLQKGMDFAKALGIPFYDNSHFPSKNPTPFLS